MKKLLLSAIAICGALSMNAQDVIFQDDFEWLAPWSAYVNGSGVPVGNTIGDNDPNAYCPFINTPKVDDVSGLQALEAKGYKVLLAQNGKTEAEAGMSCYLQVNYLKFGKSSYQSGLQLPSMVCPADKVVKLSFDWTKQRQGDGTYDPTQLVVIVENGTDVKQFAVPTLDIENNAVMSWTSTSVVLEDVTVNAQTVIKVRPEDSQWSVSGQHRWFVDNFKAEAVDAAGVNDIITDGENAPAVYYNLQGVRVDNPAAGSVVIVRKGNKAYKQLVK
ncbi:MAG: hypothetical protein ACI30N_07810 [Muribaculaceae bacterium]